MNYYCEVDIIVDAYLKRHTYAYATGALTAWVAEILYNLPSDVAEKFVERMHSATTSAIAVCPAPTDEVHDEA